MTLVTMGYAQTDITPTQSLQLVGYDARPDNYSRGVLHRLLAQTLIWQSAETICCLVTIDSLGFTTSLSLTLRQQLADALQTTPEHVMLCFSHTHAAPNATAHPDYYAFVCAQLEQAVCQARAFMVPIQAAWGSTRNTIGVNRRSPDLGFDDRLGVLQITGSDPHDLKCLLLRITAHANVLTADNYDISSDYFGAIRQQLSARYGCPILIVQGASGDVKAKYRQANADHLEVHLAEVLAHPPTPAEQQLYHEQCLRSLEIIADEVIHAVEALLPTLHPQPVHTLAMYSRHTTFYASVPDWPTAQAIAAEAQTSAGIDGTGWLEEVRRLHQAHISRQSAPCEIHYLLLNNGGLCGVPYEVMSAISTAIRQKTDAPLLFFNGYTNGCDSYLPTAPEYDLGGYEVLWSNLLYYPYHGRVMPLDRDTADQLADQAAQGYRDFWERQRFSDST